MEQSVMLLYAWLYKWYHDQQEILVRPETFYHLAKHSNNSLFAGKGP